MLLLVLDVEKHDVILIMHSYPACQEVLQSKGLGAWTKPNVRRRVSMLLSGADFSSLLSRREGGDRMDSITILGGQLPPLTWLADVSEKGP